MTKKKTTKKFQMNEGRNNMPKYQAPPPPPKPNPDPKQYQENIKKSMDGILQNLDIIYTTCEKTATSFNTDKISLRFLRIVINSARPKFVDNKSVNQLIEAYHQTLNELYQACESRAKMINKNNSDVSLHRIKFFIDFIKKEYKSVLKDVHIGN